MKKYMSILLVAVMLIACLSTNVFAATAGESEDVTFYISGNPGFAGYAATVKYDSTKLELVGLKNVFPGLMQNVNIGTNSIMGMTDVNLTGDGALFTATFKVKDGTAPGTYPVTVNITEAYDKDFNPVSFAVSGGSVTVTCNHVPGAAVKENVVPATCGVDGSYDEVVYCTVCGGEISRTTKTVPATGNHTAGAAVKENVVPATCGADGSYDEVVKCSVCGKELSRVTKTEPATGNHTAGAAVKENVVPATCGADGSYDEVVKCSVCGEELSRVTKTEPATGNHTAGAAVKENVVPATCKNDGSYDEVVKCSVCGKELSRVEKTEPATGIHTPGKVVRENEVKGDCKTKHSYDEVVYCSVCGEELSRTKVTGELGGHNYVNGKCTICGKIQDPNLDKQPDTGDIFVEIALYASFAALAVGAVVFAKRKVRG